MNKKRVRFTFPTQLIREPVIFHLGKQYGIVTNIRRADVSDERGWVILELEGDEDDIERGIAWVETQGVRVDPAIGDVVE